MKSLEKWFDILQAQSKVQGTQRCFKWKQHLYLLQITASSDDTWFPSACPGIDSWVPDAGLHLFTWSLTLDSFKEGYLFNGCKYIIGECCILYWYYTKMCSFCNKLLHNILKTVWRLTRLYGWKYCCPQVFFKTTLCTQVSYGRPARAVIVTLSQAVKLVTNFRRRCTDDVPLTLQSAVKHYYPPVILLIPWKHPVVAGNVVQALDRTWYRRWYHTAVNISATDDVPVNISSLWLVTCDFILFIHVFFMC